VVIKRVGVLSLAKVLGVLYAVIGLIIGFIVSVFSLLGAFIGPITHGSPEPLLAALFGVGAIVLFPLMYGVIGFIGGLLVAAIYNGLAHSIGGVELEFEQA
jgi:hypothetical protein